MKVAVVFLAVVSSAVASQTYNNIPDRPVKFDPLSEGYDAPERLAVIKNFGAAVLVPQRKTKFSPVKYGHGDNTHDVAPHGGNTHDVIPHGGNPHQVIPQDDTHRIIPDRSVGYGNQPISFNVGRLNNQIFTNSKSGLNAGQGNQGKIFSRGSQGFFPGKPNTHQDKRLYGLSKPSLPTTGHEIRAGNVKIGVPLVSNPIHSQLKGYPGQAPIKRIPLRTVDLGAEAVDIKTNHQGYDVNIQIPHDDILNKPVHPNPLQFPVVSVPAKDSFKGDNFFNGRIDGNIGVKGIPSTGYGNANNANNLISGDSQGGYA